MGTEALTPRFTNLSIDGFRRLHEVKLELRPLNVLIGANGSGKTSVLDVLTLLARSAQGKLSESISDLSGLASILTKDRAKDLQLGIFANAPNEQPLEYLFKLRPQGIGYTVYEEFLHGVIHDIRFGPVQDWDHSPGETGLSQIPKTVRKGEDFRKRLAASTSYGALDVHSRSPVRLPQPMRPATLPGANGEDLVSCLYSLRETDRDRFDAIEDSLRVAFPAFERLDFPPVAAGTLALTWREKNFAHPFYMHELSEGTLRFLWLATLLQSPGLTSFTLIDEPEVSLHPEMLSLLADLMREASRRTQLVVATHSDRLIRFLEPKEVVVIDSTEDGMSTLTWADKLDIDEWLKDYSLDELWQNGRIGARP